MVQKSAIRGCPYAQIVVGDFIKKPKEKIDWFTKAAESGVPMAQYYAAFYSDLMGWGAWKLMHSNYFAGRRCTFAEDEKFLQKLWGVKDARVAAKFRIDALRWYRKASDNGVSAATRSLRMHKVLPRNDACRSD